MRLYLIQHADAVEKDVDPDRPLSPHGISAATNVARFLHQCEVKIPRLYHSEKLRSIETAAIFADYLSSARALLEELDPKENPEAAIRMLASATEDVGFVGHLPHLSLLAARLLRTKSSHQPIAFSKAGVVALELQSSGSWTVLWMVTPELLRAEKKS